MGAIPWQTDFLTSREVHAGLREQYDMPMIKELCDRPGPAYSCAILGSGALGCTTAAAAPLLKPIYATEIDKWMRSVWVDVCATI